MGSDPPQRLVRALGETYGEEAADWLGRLPALTEEAVSAPGHELVPDRVVAPGGRSSLVLLAHRPDGAPAALKLAPPLAAPARERAALAHWNGWGAVELLLPADTVLPGGALLLERLHPEVSLRSLPEAKALLEAAGTVRRLWIEPRPGHPFGTVAERTARQAEGMRAAAAREPELE
ncbi:aminoglycoside phosphotransferase family protein, partial [Streptomyces sp. NRRL WC-3549]|uniref:aminoglycoside phosphotransferase family protein n=1 Tax=Streptomyces sp. NRRL WC-3549 TaxID=1463925 RepID=UPI0004C938AC